ncbi:MAG TPA: isoprenylcysteine carboxylmethyltransferase family protein, partial [Candidatus Sulfotelmatobacter sp.]|nr:isoprenylcysteine carboxylmethyltransferase family protein [Candidatus Sulfotelmatobacter sp.]
HDSRAGDDPWLYPLPFHWWLRQANEWPSGVARCGGDHDWSRNLLPLRLGARRARPGNSGPNRSHEVSGHHRVPPVVRNPMYIGVFLVLAGEAFLFRSLHLLEYMAFFCVIVELFVLYYEEPTLRRQFGESYEQYRRTVPRWIPKFKVQT